MLRAFIKKIWLLAVALVLAAAVLPVQAADPPEPVRVLAASGDGGKLILQADGQDPVEVAGSRKKLELKAGDHLRVQAQADSSAVIESLQINEQAIESAAGKSSWSHEYDLAEDLQIEVRFASDSQSASTEARESPSSTPMQDSGSRQGQDSSLESSAGSGSEQKLEEEKDLKASDDLGNQEEEKTDSSEIASSDDDDREEVSGQPASEAQVHIAATQASQPLTVDACHTYRGIPVANARVTNSIWTLSNGRHAFCANYLYACPRIGASTTAPYEVNSASLRKALYYGFEGPGNILGRWNLSAAQQAVITDDMASEAMGNGSISRNVKGADSWEALVEGIWKTVLAQPDPADYKAMMVDVQGSGLNFQGINKPMQPLVYGEVVEKPGPGNLFLKKVSAEPTMTVIDLDDYSLEGALFAVYRGTVPNELERVASLTTNAMGYTPIVTLDPGQYCVKEITAPSGFLRNTEVRQIEIREGYTASMHNNVVFKEDPILFEADVLLRKYNVRDQHSLTPSLAGAEFTLRYYGTAFYTPTDQLAEEADKTWIYRTDSKGELKLDAAHYVGGDEPFIRSDGKYVMPYGVLTIEETKAPAGYQRDKTLRRISVGKGVGGVSPFASPVLVPEVPLDLELLKIDEETKKPLAGAVFMTWDPQGKKKEWTTDANGRIEFSFETTGRWTLCEKTSPAGYHIDLNIIYLDVKADRVEVSGLLSGESISGKLLTVVNRHPEFTLNLKKRSPDGADLSGAKFTLYKSDGKTEVETVTTDRRGAAAFRARRAGVWFVAETAAPPGYAAPVDANGKPVLHKLEAIWSDQDQKFTLLFDGKNIRESSDWAYDETPLGDPILIWSLVNTPVRILPSTGSVTQPACSMASLVLTSAGLGVSRKRGRRSGRNTEEKFSTCHRQKHRHKEEEK